MAKVRVENDTVSEVEIDESQIVLDKILDDGIKFPYGCRAGACGACSTIVTAGTENLARVSPVEEDTIKRVSAELSESDKALVDSGAVVRMCCRMRTSGDITIRPTHEK